METMNWVYISLNDTGRIGYRLAKSYLEYKFEKQVVTKSILLQNRIDKRIIKPPQLEKNI